ncbi:MAG: penicillin-binding protein 1A [Janthinobacterium lividum]
MPLTTHPEPPTSPVARKRPLWIKLLIGFIGFIAALLLLGGLLAAYALVVARPNLPSLDAVTDYRPKIPLRIFTADHVLIGEFGEERRRLMHFDEIPDMMKKAVLAIEDDRFYEHGAVDFQGVARAGLANFSRGGSAQGASTITMQVARNFFLSSEKTYTRKIYEMLLAYKIESALSKDQILELYMNQIYLGQHAYGFASAARIYFGKDLKDITLAEAAMLAGLPKAPSAYNPIVNPTRAKVRQEYILKRMLELHYIDATQYQAALAQPIHTHVAPRVYSVHAEYVAEMVRQMLYAQYKDDTYTRGFNVVTTIDSADQEAAYQAVRKGVMDFDRGQPYRGPEASLELPTDAAAIPEAVDDALEDRPATGEIIAAVVTSANPRQVQAMRVGGETLTVTGNGLKFVASALESHGAAGSRIRPGSVIRLVQDKDGNWSITQLPQVESALVSMEPQSGAIRALIGGFDFNKNNFNHVTQAWRQPGSSFKPFVYSASLDKGLAPATIINDAPISFPATQPGGKSWDPKNLGGVYDGPISMRTALKKSKNSVSIRILNYIGTKYGQQFVTRFGFDASRTPAYLPMALGAGQVTPLQMAGAYSVFANGGYRINPYLIAEITDPDGALLTRAAPLIAGQNAPRVIDPRNDYLMNSLLQSVAQAGSGARSNQLGRKDLAGKTGTTNDSNDAWFAGYQHTLVAITWIGYDQPRSLGRKAQGSNVALPIWIGYMAHALRGVPEYRLPVPEGVTIIDGEPYYSTATPGNGLVASIGVAAPADAASDAVPVTGEERQQILDMFQGNTPDSD